MATSRSLGTLTLDLVARIQGFTEGMSKAEREADRKGRDIARKQKQSAKEIDAAWNKTTQAIGAAFAAISVGALASKLAGVSKETANLAIEYDKLATLSGTTNGGFQRFAAGAETVGISAEKLADIFKDVQDKAGDFAQTGGGGMADFFENIAPKVGVTIEQFRRLSGPEAMQLYVSSLEKANISQQDMIFYMEAIASDSSLLLPLLRDNGAEFDRLGDAAERAGAIMGTEALNAAREYKAQAEELDRSMKGLRVEVMEQMLPALTQLTAVFSDSATRQAIADYAGWLGQIATNAAQFAQIVSESSLWGWLQTGSTDAKNAAAEIAKVEAQMARVKETRDALERAGGGWLHVEDIAVANSQLSTMAAKLDALRAQQRQAERADAAARRGLGMQVGLGALESYVPEGDRVSVKPLSPVVSKPKGASGKSQIEKDKEAADRYLKSLRDLAEGRREMNALEQLAYDIQEKRVKLSDADYAAAEKLATLAVFRADGLEREKEQEQERNRLLQEGASLTEAMLTPTERYAEQIHRLNELMGAGAIDAETYARAVDKYYKDMTDQSTDYTKQAAENMQNILGDWLYNGLQGSWDNILQSFVQMLLRMEAQALAANIMGAITGGATGGGSILGGLFGGLFGGGRAHGGTVSPGKLYEVNEQGPELITSGGKTYLMAGSQAGYVTPAATASTTAGSGGGLTVNVPVSLTVDGGDDPAAARGFGESLARAMKATAQEEIQRASLPGGQLWAMRNGRG